MDTFIRYYFNFWKNKVKRFKDYDEWCELNNERLREEEFAEQNNMESIYWCWNCKYSDCDKHGCEV